MICNMISDEYDDPCLSREIYQENQASGPAPHLNPQWDTFSFDLLLEAFINAQGSSWHDSHNPGTLRYN